MSAGRIIFPIHLDVRTTKHTQDERGLPYSSTPFSLVSLFLKIPPSDLFRLLLVRVVNIDGNFGKEEKSNSACNLLALPIVAVEMTCKNSSVRPPPSTHTIVDMRLLVRVCVRSTRASSFAPANCFEKERVKADYTHLQRIFEGGNMTPPSLPHRGFYFSLRENRECVCCFSLISSS